MHFPEQPFNGKFVENVVSYIVLSLNNVFYFLVPVMECGKFSSLLHFLIVPRGRTQSAVATPQLLFCIAVICGGCPGTVDFQTCKIRLGMLQIWV